MAPAETAADSYVVVGGGILGAAVARELVTRRPGVRVTLLEKEPELAAHQTGHNSGVVHAGLYYEPGGLKARLCRRGVDLLKEFCVERGLAYDECGKVVVALREDELPRLRAIAERARANGVPGIGMLDRAGLREVEPEAEGRAALHSPHTAIVDYRGITAALVADARAAGAELRLGTTVRRLRPAPGGGAVVETDGGDLTADRVICCAGLQSDRLAERSGGPAQPRIVPFFGQYYALTDRDAALVRGLIYPVPDPRYPFLGVHLTPTVDRGVLIGPNAFLALGREDYRGLRWNPADIADIARRPGFWRFAARNAPTAGREIRTVLSRERFVAEARAYVPGLRDTDVTPVPRGIRAQAMDAGGRLLDDFAIDHLGPTVHIRNAPSPAATSSLAIAEYIVDTQIG